MRWTHGTIEAWLAGKGGKERTAGVSERVVPRADLRRVGEGERERDRERDLDRSESACDPENERMCERDEILSRSSRTAGSSPIDCAAASRRRSRSSSSSGGSGGGAEISMTSENMNWVGGGGGRIFLFLLRCREKGRAMAEESSMLPRARL